MTLTKSLRVAIHQPNFFPRLKVLQKLSFADVWVVLDSVAYNPREWQNRTQIVPMRSEDPYWISLPVRHQRRQQRLIHETVTIPEPDFGTRLSKSLHHAFRRAPHWSDIQDLLRDLESTGWEGALTDICIATTQPFLAYSAHMPKVVRSSALSSTGSGSQLIASICRELGATTYLADTGATRYLDQKEFAGIEILWQHWTPPVVCAPRMPWRDISPLNYLGRAGKIEFEKHLQLGSFSKILPEG